MLRAVLRTLAAAITTTFSAADRAVAFDLYSVQSNLAKVGEALAEPGSMKPLPSDVAKSVESKLKTLGRFYSGVGVYVDTRRIYTEVMNEGPGYAEKEHISRDVGALQLALAKGFGAGTAALFSAGGKAAVISGAEKGNRSMVVVGVGAVATSDYLGKKAEQKLLDKYHTNNMEQWKVEQQRQKVIASNIAKAQETLKPQRSSASATPIRTVTIKPQASADAAKGKDGNSLRRDTTPVNASPVQKQGAASSNTQSSPRFRPVSPAAGGVHAESSSGRQPDGSVRIGGDGISVASPTPSGGGVRTDSASGRQPDGSVRIGGDGMNAPSSQPSGGGVRTESSSGRQPDGSVRIGGNGMNAPSSPPSGGGVRMDSSSGRQPDGSIRIGGDGINAPSSASANDAPQDGMTGRQQGDSTRIGGDPDLSRYQRPSASLGSAPSQPQSQKVAQYERPPTAVNTPPGTPCLDYNTPGPSTCKEDGGSGKKDADLGQDTPVGGGNYKGRWAMDSSTCAAPVTITETAITGMMPAGHLGSGYGLSCSGSAVTVIQYPSRWAYQISCTGVNQFMEIRLSQLDAKRLAMTSCPTGAPCSRSGTLTRCP